MTTEQTDLAGDQSASGAAQPRPATNRVVDRLNRQIVTVATVLGFGLPVFLYLWLIQHYSVNVIFQDQWDDVTVIHNSYSHWIDWSSLWAQHNENRIFFPNLIVVLLAHTTHFNIQVEDYLSATMLAVATALLIWAHKRRSPSTPLLYYCPVALLSLSIVQFENALWGFQMAWYLVLLSLSATVVLVDRVTLTWSTFIGAIATAAIGSFSSLQGLLIWPVGLLLLYHRRRERRFVLAWVIAAAAAFAVYLYHFNTSANAGSPSHGYALQHPLATIKFYVFEVGDVIGLPRQYNGPGSNGVLLLGSAILVLAVVTVLAYGIRRDDRGGGPIGVALILVGLLFAALVTEGRIRFGYLSASASRYTTYDLLIPIGIYLAMLGRPAPAPHPQDLHSVGEPRSETSRFRGVAGSVAWVDRNLWVARWIVAVVIAVQIVLGLHYGIDGARRDHAQQAQSARVLRNIDHTPDTVVRYYLYFLKPASFTRRQARVAVRYDLSLFAYGARPEATRGYISAG